MPTSEIFNTDCLAAMREMPDKCFDLAIVDPPYGLDVANMNMGVGNSKKCSKKKNRKWVKSNWDNSIPSDEYFYHLFRASKNQMIFGGNYFNLPPCKFYIIWDKEVPEGLSFADCEMCWTSLSHAPRIFRYSAYLDKKEKFHPTQKPVALYKWLLKNYAKPGDRILDTHLGSGSSRIAAYDMGFDFVGYELDAEYFEASDRRFKNHISNLQMFTPDEMYQNEQKKLF